MEISEAIDKMRLELIKDSMDKNDEEKTEDLNAVTFLTALKIKLEDKIEKDD